MDGVIVISPILESAMKSTAVEKTKNRFIELFAEDPRVEEAIDEMYKSFAFVDGNFNNGNYNRNAKVNLENVEGYIRGSRLKELMEICEYSIVINKEDGKEYVSSINKESIENIDDAHEYIFYVYKDTITVADMTLYAELKYKASIKGGKSNKRWMYTKNNKLTNKARNRLYKSMVFMDACYDDVTDKTNCTSLFRKPIKGKLCKKYLRHCKYPGSSGSFENTEDNRYYVLVKYYDALEISEVYHLYGKSVAEIHGEFRVIY